MDLNVNIFNYDDKKYMIMVILYLVWNVYGIKKIRKVLKPFGNLYMDVVTYFIFLTVIIISKAHLHKYES